MKFKKFDQHDDAFKEIKFLFLIVFLRDIVIDRPSSFIFRLMLGVCLSLILLNWIYKTKISDMITMENVQPEIRAYKGQEGVLRYRLKLHRWLPIFRGRIRVTAGRNILFHHEVDSPPKNLTQTEFIFSLMPKSEKLIEIPFIAQHRGISRITESEIIIDQPFGFGKIHLRAYGQEERNVLIYPDRFAIHNESLKDIQLPGFFAKKQALFKDPLLMIGSRAYVHGDPLRDIHWKLSAKTGELITKQYQPTSHLSVQLMINLRSLKSFIPPENMEQILEKIAYMTAIFAKEEIPYRISINLKTSNQSNRYFQMSEGSGKRHYRQTLELLAKLNIIAMTVPMEKVIADILKGGQLPTHLIVTGQFSSALMDELRILSLKGVVIYQLDQHGLTLFELSDFKQEVRSDE